MGLLASYVVALALVSTPAARRLLSTLDPKSFGLLCALAAMPGLLALYHQGDSLAEGEGLPWLTASLPDRLRLEHTPSIAPPLLSADRPQSFWVHAPSSKNVGVRFGSGARLITAQPLGGALFRVDYDPRRHGLPNPSDGPLEVTIMADGHRHRRTMHAATPLAHPRWFCLSPSGSLAATVSEETDTLVVLSERAVVARIATEDGPVDCAFVDDAHLIVSHRYNHALAWIELPSKRITHHLDVGAGQGRLAMSPDHSLLAVALDGSALALVDVSRRRIQQRLALDATPEWLSFGTTRNTLIISSRQDAKLRRLRSGARGHFSQDTALSLGRPAVTMARGHDGQHVIVATTDYRPSGRPQLGNHFIQDQLLTVDVEEMRVTRRLLTARRSERQAKPGDVDRGLSPMGVFDSAQGTLMAFAGSDEVWRLANTSDEPDIMDLERTDMHAPHGVIALANRTLLVSSPAYGSIGVLAPGAVTPRVVHVAANNTTLLHENRAALQRRIGEHGFYEGTRSGISCQSCHMHGDSDDAGYNLGDHRLVPTLSVRGLLGTSPYLRDGTYPRVADLDGVAQHLYRGYLHVRGGRGATLEAYIYALPRMHVEPQPEALARQRKGRVAFEKAGCAQCHSYPAFTNLGQVPVQALFPDEARTQPAGEMLDVPSLLSVAKTPPYLNDGRAKNLEEVLGRWNKHNLHGNTQSLSKREHADLIVFLSSL